MNSYVVPSTSPMALLKSFVANRRLIFNLTRREISCRYRGSMMGLLWSFFNPVLMLAVYTFVFSVVFKARWSIGGGSKVEFAMILFISLMCFNIFSECINRAPCLIISNANYVKKIIFPLEVFPFVAIGAALFHFFISLLVWLLFYVFFLGIPSMTVLFFPIVLFPLILFTLGFTWFLASFGVYLRDIAQIVGIITMVLMYLTPIFYPISALPEQYQIIMHINPLTDILEQVRNVMIFRKGVVWPNWFCHLCISFCVAWLGFVWFQKTRAGFADVI